MPFKKRLLLSRHEAGFRDFAHLFAETILQIRATALGQEVLQLTPGGRDGFPRLLKGLPLPKRIAEPVQQEGLFRSGKERLVIVRTVQIDEMGTEIAQQREVAGGTIEKLPSTALRGDGSLEDEFPFLARLDARFLQKSMHGRIRQDVEDRLKTCGGCPGPHQSPVGPLTEKELQGTENDRLTGTGLASDSGESRRKIPLQGLNEGQVANAERPEHCRHVHDYASVRPVRTSRMPSLELTFLGTGTSQGVPMVGCPCEVCHSTDPRDHRTRASLLLRFPDLHAVIDTPPDFRQQCLREGIRRVDAALFTHPHTDHIMGFDDLRRFCEMEDREMPVHASPSTMAGLREAFRFAFDEPRPWKNYLRLSPRPVDGPFLLGETTVTPVDLPHGRFVSTGYVFSRGGRRLLAYYTDCSDLTPEAVDAARGVEILVLDALRDTPHPTHMSIAQAIEASRAVLPRGTWLTHLCHEVSHAARESDLPENVRLAYDGLTLLAGDHP